MLEAGATVLVPSTRTEVAPARILQGSYPLHFSRKEHVPAIVSVMVSPFAPLYDVIDVFQQQAAE